MASPHRWIQSTGRRGRTMTSFNQSAGGASPRHAVFTDLRAIKGYAGIAMIGLGIATTAAWSAFILGLSLRLLGWW